MAKLVLKKNNISFTNRLSLSSLDSRFNLVGKTSKTVINLREEFIKKIDHMNISNDNFSLAGGNYSVLFLLPAMIKVIKKNYPFLSMNIVLYETTNNKDYISCNHQCIFFSYNESNQHYREIRMMGYDLTKLVAKDTSYFSASKEAVEKFGGKKECLKKMNICYGRSFKESSLSEEIAYDFQTTPTGREEELPIIISDLLFFSYLLIKYGTCVWLHCASAPYEKDIVFLEKIVDLNRSFMFKKKAAEVSKKIKKEMKKFIGNIKESEKKYKSNS